MQQQASLVVVGSGIKFLSHLTIEARSYILQSDKVMYLVNDPAMQSWITANNKNSESLDELYFKYPNRIDCYQSITRHILNTLRTGVHLCVVIYGHPTLYAQPGLDAVIKAKEEGYYAKVLPGISSEDCLFADLLIDPSSCGLLSYEATDLILSKRLVDQRSHLIIWQIGNLNEITHSLTGADSLVLFLEYLYQYYPPEHEVILYKAALYPFLESIKTKIALKNIKSGMLTKITTLYVPPNKK